MDRVMVSNQNDIKNRSDYPSEYRNPRQSQEYIVPPHFVTIPTNNIQKRIMKNVQNTRNRRRISFPPSIKEENEDEEMSVQPQTAAAEDIDDEDVPLAILAYRKGLSVPDRIESAFPVIPHVPTASHQSQTKYASSRRPSLKDSHPRSPSPNSFYHHNQQDTHQQYNNRHYYDNTVVNFATTPYSMGDLKQQQLQPYQQSFQLNMNYPSSPSSASSASASSSDIQPSLTTRTRRAHSSKKGFFRRQSLQF